jgi:alkylhydroperoxidase/carboxymuconolactone decarboxylase family protein YurZ
MLSLLAEHEEALMRAQVDDPVPGWPNGLDQRTRHLVRLAALIAVDAPEAAFASTIRAALRSGVSPGQVVDVLMAIARTVGIARVVAASPRIGAALGLEIDPALER